MRAFSIFKWLCYIVGFHPFSSSLQILTKAGTSTSGTRGHLWPNVGSPHHKAPAYDRRPWTLEAVGLNRQLIVLRSDAGDEVFPAGVKLVFTLAETVEHFVFGSDDKSRSRIGISSQY